MRLSFGKAVGTAARVDAGQAILSVFSTPQYLDKVKAAMRNGSHKLPSPSHLKVHTIKVSGRIVAVPKFAGDKIEEVVKPVAEAEIAAEPAAKGAEAGRGAHKGAETGKGAHKGADAAKGAEPAKGADAAKGAEPAKGAKHAKGGKSH